MIQGAADLLPSLEDHGDDRGEAETIVVETGPLGDTGPVEFAILDQLSETYPLGVGVIMRTAKELTGDAEGVPDVFDRLAGAGVIVQHPGMKYTLAPKVSEGARADVRESSGESLPRSAGGTGWIVAGSQVSAPRPPDPPAGMAPTQPLKGTPCEKSP